MLVEPLMNVIEFRGHWVGPEHDSRQHHRREWGSQVKLPGGIPVEDVRVLNVVP